MKIDQAAIETLTKLLEGSKLTELEYQQGDEKIKLKKAPAPVVEAVAPVAMSSDDQPVRAPRTDVVEGHTINAPTVGIFYTAKSPQEPPYVQVGDEVKQGQIVGVIEAMKVFTNVVADVDGVVERVLVNNEEGVEYGQPLIQIQ